MSLIKDLRNKPENSINLVEMLSLLCPEGKSKYVETLLRIMRSTENIKDYKEEVVKSLVKDYNINASELSEFDAVQLIHLKKFLEDMFLLSDVQAFQKFCDFNERSLVTDNDLSRYKTFEQVVKTVEQVELKLVEKELETQIVKLYESEEWLMLKPITYEASKKYGASTKWCTTMENEGYHFEKYAKGILIYALNRKTNYKVACYKSLTDTELSFWNATDDRIDSLDTELPMELLNVIKTEIKNCKKGNSECKSK